MKHVRRQQRNTLAAKEQVLWLIWQPCLATLNNNNKPQANRDAQSALQTPNRAGRNAIWWLSTPSAKGGRNREIGIYVWIWKNEEAAANGLFLDALYAESIWCGGTPGFNDKQKCMAAIKSAWKQTERSWVVLCQRNLMHVPGVSQRKPWKSADYFHTKGAYTMDWSLGFRLKWVWRRAVPSEK